jgi:hypothetical protein
MEPWVQTPVSPKKKENRHSWCFFCIKQGISSQESEMICHQLFLSKYTCTHIRTKKITRYSNRKSEHIRSENIVVEGCECELITINNYSTKILFFPYIIHSSHITRNMQYLFNMYSVQLYQLEINSDDISEIWKTALYCRNNKWNQQDPKLNCQSLSSIY